MIKNINIDPNGLCNAKCWFCPVAYEGNPKKQKTNMPLDLMESILFQLDAGRGEWVSKKIYNAPIHFNEVLLYPYFKEMLDLHRKYKVSVSIYTNGVNLTKEKTDTIVEYRDVVDLIALNVPSLNAEQWSKFTGFNIKIFPKLIENLKYAEEKLSTVYSPEDFYIMANGVDEKSLFKNGGWIEMLEDAPNYNLDLNNGTLATIVKEMKEILPNTNIWGRNNLGDRTGVLEELKIISNQSAVNQRNSGKVIGCGLRFDERLYIAANGDVYICAIDFNYEIVYGNVKETPLKEIWQGSRREDAIKKSYETLCQSCLHAIKEEGSGPSLVKVIK
jgi:radical SAM protein with 4Fe4S-binding SPASM domain